MGVCQQGPTALLPIDPRVNLKLNSSVSAHNLINSGLNMKLKKVRYTDG